MRLGGADVCVIEPQEQRKRAPRGSSIGGRLSAWQANTSEEAYNNPVCVQGRVIPPVLGFGLTAAQMSVWPRRVKSVCSFGSRREKEHF